jgi:hypothetical protein
MRWTKIIVLTWAQRRRGMPRRPPSQLPGVSKARLGRPPLGQARLPDDQPDSVHGEPRVTEADGDDHRLGKKRLEISL